MRRLLPVLFLLLVCAPPARAQSSPTVAVRDDFFAPERVSVKAGTTITWTWEGVRPHDVTFYDGPSSGSPTTPPYTYRRTFTTPGTYGYHCRAHPASMTGEVTVVGAAQSPTPKPTTASPRPTSASPTPTRTPSPTPTRTPSRTPSRTPTPARTTTPPALLPPTTPPPTTPPPTTAPPLVLDTPVPPDRTGIAIAAGLLVGLAGLGTAGALFVRGRRA